MKEKFITLDTALLADNKGYPFGRRGMHVITQSLLQRWLREEHNYHFICEIGIENNDLKKPYFKYRMYNPEIGASRIGGIADSYEQALEEAEQQTLIEL